MKLDAGITPEQRRLLQSKNHGFNQLVATGSMRLGEMLNFVGLPVVIFEFCLICLCSSLRYHQEDLLAHVRITGLMFFLTVPTVTIFVFLVGVMLSREHTVVSWPAVTYWGYWPFWRALLCWAAMYSASDIGNHLWYTYFLPHLQLDRLQVYHQLDPDQAPGRRLQDAGVVEFDAKAGVDRAKASCLRSGSVYCIAPIIVGDEINASSRGGSQDLFMAGRDCCSCEGEDVGGFRCGDWSKPISKIGYAKQIGGLRVVNGNYNDFYRLASDDWATTYHKEVNHAIFFEWVDHPALALQDMQNRGERLMWCALLGAPLASLILGQLLRVLFGYLRETGAAAPTGAPVPVGLGHGVNKRFFPDMHADREERQAQMSAETLKYSIL
eukprot:TRINITY_DN26456_c0_g1_i1.p1 TRINITY_DN26456_c0_g1~~TRINITY_DN26456_c0_g1_i1.p1  ORF type:complete len:382 (+),score=87.08 TRINITY_DN26456_c0_g1_i1:97-1242(+)